MRRIIHNTTAIAASIALLAPQFAMAEMRLPDRQVNEQRQIRAEAMPRLAAILQEEIDKGLTVDGLACANGDARPCADNVRLVTPRGVAVQVSESGMLMLAPRGQQVAKASGKADGKTDGQAREDRRPPAVQPVEGGDAAARSAEREARRAAKAAEDAARDAAKADAAKRVTAQNQPEPSTADALAAALGQRLKEGDSLLSGKTELNDNGRLRLAEGDSARQRSEAMPGLARVLADEIDSGLTRDQLTCQTGGAAPCAEGIALMTPRGVAVAVGENGAVGLLPAQRQMNSVNARGQVIPRAPESDTVETAAAQEAAKEVSAPIAAALEAADGAGKIVARQDVTDANTRSSSEDFEASLRDALAEASGTGTTPTRQQNDAAAEDDDDDNDLAKALILGLGAVAVGQMLNNNRQVALSTPDRVVVQRADGSQEVIKDEVALLRQPGSTVTTEDFDDGSSRTIVTRADGSKVVTIRDADLRVLRRTLISADGTTTRLIDDTADVRPVDVTTLPEPAPILTPTGTMTEEQLRDALSRESGIDRRFTLGQIRNIPEVRALVAPVNIDAITFDTGSAAISPDQAQQLASLGRVIQGAIARNPREVFMIEGHTDTVGAGAMNLALSDRRAESVALALSEYFDVPPENLIVQGYGEQFLKVRAEGDIRANRRASVRRITDLLQTAQTN